tara:strand:- start:379 stop:906 length:528 start_codon:yes stop_codon:yes gene_type:complete
MTEEILTQVDENDNVIGPSPNHEVWKNKLIHRAANVIVSNEKGQIFVHQRKIGIKIYSGKWDMKFGGAVIFGETYEDAAKRELEEEAGIKDVKLTFLFPQKFRSDIRNVNRQVFIITYEGPFNLQKEEVEQGKFMTIPEIKELEKKGMLSPTGIQVFNQYLQQRGETKYQKLLKI